MKSLSAAAFAAALLVVSPTLSLSAISPTYAASVQVGVASWYGPGLQGNLTANGETFDMNRLTAAHPSLPFNTRVRVTNQHNGRSVIVRINDRGPFVGGRIIDLSRAAASELGMINRGTATVTLEILG